MSNELLDENDEFEINEDNFEEETVQETDEEVEEFFNKIDYDANLRSYYSSFSNFPYQVKKEIIINLTVFGVVSVLFIYLVFFVKYFSFALLAVEILVAFYTLVSSYYTVRNIKSVSFTLFRGKIEDSINIGIRNKTTILKIRSIDDTKTICIRYCDNKTLYLDQDVTIFLPSNAIIKQSQYGPMVEHYIAIIPTDELKAEEDVKELKTNNMNKDVTVEDYLK